MSTLSMARANVLHLRYSCSMYAGIITGGGDCCACGSWGAGRHGGTGRHGGVGWVARRAGAKATWGGLSGGWTDGRKGGREGQRESSRPAGGSGC